MSKRVRARTNRKIRKRQSKLVNRKTMRRKTMRRKTMRRKTMLRKAMLRKAMRRRNNKLVGGSQNSQDAMGACVAGVTQGIAIIRENLQKMERECAERAPEGLAREEAMIGLMNEDYQEHEDRLDAEAGNIVPQNELLE